MLVLLLFFCSGATALVYEVIWSKYLALVFGSTSQAQTTVLAVFMGGLAIGNRLFGGHADRCKRPLAIYGIIEIAIGVYALLFPLVYRLAENVFAAVGAGLLDHAGALLLLKGSLSVALLLGPTILMGGTLPLVAAWLQRSTPDAGRRSARFYSTNSLGAVCGAWLAGFFLVPQLGMTMTMTGAAIVNVLVGLTAIGIARRETPPIPASGPETEATKGALGKPGDSLLFRWGCVLVALTGAISMGLEVLASRCLGLIFGSSLQAFTIMLMAFILGIGLGSAVIASPRKKHWPGEITTFSLLLGAAVWIGLLVFNIENLAALYSYTQDGLARTAMGYRYRQILTALISICVLGLPAAALGAVLPLWMRVVSQTTELLGDRVGRLLTWNTLGAVGGTLLMGFVLMPGIGLRASFAVLALVLGAAATFTALAARKLFAAGVGVVVSTLLIFVAATGGEGWRLVLSAGVFRLPNGLFSPAYLEERRQSVKLLFYEDASDATVSVEQNILPNGTTNFTLRINGKPDASSPVDLSTQVLLGQLPMMMRPEAKDVFCLGLGSGISAGTTLGYPIERLVVADNCRPVLRAAKFFESLNHGVLTNSRTRIYHEDARTVLKLSRQKYDVIISEPSNPWMAGIGSVFSREFYEVAASRLKPGGIMSQWLFTYELDDDILNLVIRTMGSVFPVLEIWDVGEGDIVILGSDRPWRSDLEVYRRPFSLEGPRRDLASIGLTSPEAVLARQFASQRTAFAMPGPGPVQRDGHPILEYEAPRGFYIYLGRGATGFQRFDERTWQMDLAFPWKNEVLSGLELAQLNTIFGGIAPSVNHDLQAYLRNRFEGRAGSLVFGNRVMPCVFQETNAGTVLFAPASVQTNIIVQQLYTAEAVLRTDPTRQLQAIESIKNVLASLPSYQPKEADWSAAYYAELAVKAGLRLGRVTEAKAILLRGLQLEPKSEELRYLSRVMAREGILSLTEISPDAMK